MLKKYISDLIILFKKNKKINIISLMFTLKKWKLFGIIHLILYFLGLINLMFCRNLYLSNPIHFASFKILLTIELLKKKKSISEKIDFLSYTIFVWLFVIFSGYSLKSLQLCFNFTDKAVLYAFKNNSINPIKIFLNFIKKEFTFKVITTFEIRFLNRTFKIHRHTDK